MKKLYKNPKSTKKTTSFVDSDMFNSSKPEKGAR